MQETRKRDNSFKTNSGRNQICLKILACGLIAIMLTSVLPANTVLADKDEKPKHAPGILLIKFKDDTDEKVKDQILSENMAKVVDEIPQLKIKIIKVPENALDSIESALQKKDAVKYVEKDFLMEPALIPNDPYFSSQWHLSKIQAPSAWDISKGIESASIAILDTGVDPTHPDLAGKLLPGYNFYDNNNNWADVCGHGTLVAGTAAAITNNGLGVSGVAWQNKILPIRITDINCYGYYSAMINGIVFAADNGAKAANISFHIFDGAALTDAAKYMYDKGGWVVAAAGNTANYQGYTDNPYMVSVSATDSSDTLSTFSSYGPYVDFAAPGSGIYTTAKGGSYSYVSGTSFSSPITAGVIALLFSQNPSMTSQDVYNSLKQSSKDLGNAGYDYSYGWGRIDAYKALGGSGNPVDNTPPAVSITTPTDGSTVSGSITASVDAIDDTGVSKVQMYIDNVLYGEDTSKPYDFIVDTTKFGNGQHSLKTVAYDTSSNSASSQNTVNVSNVSGDNTPPTVSITSPLAGSTVSGRVKVSVSATDNVGVKNVELYIDGKSWTGTGSQLTVGWNTRSTANGIHTITAWAFDTNGNGASTSIDVTVANRSK